MIKLTLCLLFSLYVNISDWKSFKIKNKPCVIFLILGLILQFFSAGIDGLLSGLSGAAIMLVLFPFFALRMLGAGDVKALMAMGGMLGCPMAGWLLIDSILGGGVIALAILILRRNGKQRLRYFWNYLKLCFFTVSIHEYTPKLEANKETFRFSFGITIGMLILVLQFLGILLPI